MRRLTEGISAWRAVRWRALRAPHQKERSAVDMAGMTDSAPEQARLQSKAAGLGNVANAAFAGCVAAPLAAFVVSGADIDRNFTSDTDDALALIVLGIVTFACMVWFLRALRFTSAPALTATALGTAGLLWYWANPAVLDHDPGTGLLVAITAGAATLIVAVLASALRHKPVRADRHDASERIMHGATGSDGATPSPSHVTYLRWAVSAALATTISIAVTVLMMWQMDHRWWGPVTRAASIGMRERVQPEMVMMMTATACLGIVTAVALTLAFAIRLPRHPASIIATAALLAFAWAALHSAAADRSLTGMGFCLEGTNGHVHPDDPITLCG